MDLTTIFTLAAAGIPVGIAALSTFFTVREKEEALVTQFGKYAKTSQAGLNFKLPWPIQSVAARVPKSMQQFRDELDIKTKDDIFPTLPVTVHYLINDTRKYHFDVDGDPRQQISAIVNATVREQTANMDSEELYTKRDEISNAVIQAVSDEMADYGVDIKRVVIDEPKFPAEIQNAYNNVRASERKRQAAENEAEAEKIRIVKESEAKRVASANLGKGIAEQRAAIFENYSEQLKVLEEKGIPQEQAVAIMTKAMEQDTLRDIGDKGNLIVTSSANSADQIANFQALRQSGPGPV